MDLLVIDTESFDLQVLLTTLPEGANSHGAHGKVQIFLILYEHAHLSSSDQEQALNLLQLAGYETWPLLANTLAVMRPSGPLAAEREQTDQGPNRLTDLRGPAEEEEVKEMRGLYRKFQKNAESTHGPAGIGLLYGRDKQRRGRGRSR